MIQKFIQTGIMSNDWSDLTGVDKVTYDTAKKIEVMSNGLTVKQFQEALSIALDFVNRYSILSTQSFQKEETQD
jgi:hypothetical protein